MSSDNPSSPVGSKQYRVVKAIHWHFCTEKTQSDIADELGVSVQKVSEYVNSPPGQETQEALEHQEVQTRLVAFQELKHQLQVAGEASRTAEKPVKVWQDGDGHLQVRDIHDEETGELISKEPVPYDLEMGPDETARYFRREEVREILDRMVTLTGAAEPEQHEHSGELTIAEMLSGE